MSGNLPRSVAGLLRWPRNRLVHPFSGKKTNKTNGQRWRERPWEFVKEKQKKYSGQPTVLLSFFSWVEGVVYVDAPVSLAHLSNLEHVRVSVKSYRCIEWNQTSFSMQTAGKRLCRLVWSTSSSSALLQPPFIIPAQYICVYMRTNLRLILLIIQIFIVTSKKSRYRPTSILSETPGHVIQHLLFTAWEREQKNWFDWMHHQFRNQEISRIKKTTKQNQK